MLVAPVCERGSVTRMGTFPEGNWIDARSGDIISGSGEREIEAPLEVLPLFIRAGAIIPLREYAPSIGSGNNDRLLLHVHHAEKSSFTLFEGDGRSNDYQKGIFATTRIDLESNGDALEPTIHPIRGRYKGIKLEREWVLALHVKRKPSLVRLNRKEIA